MNGEVSYRPLAEQPSRHVTNGLLWWPSTVIMASVVTDRRESLTDLWKWSQIYFDPARKPIIPNEAHFLLEKLVLRRLCMVLEIAELNVDCIVPTLVHAPLAPFPGPIRGRPGNEANASLHSFPGPYQK